MPPIPTMSCYERMISMNGRLQGKARNDRRLLFLLSAIGAPVALAFFMVSEKLPVTCLSTGFSMAAALPLMLLCVFGIDIKPWHQKAYLVLASISVVFFDLEMRAFGNPPVWSMFVILADMCLVLRVGNGFAGIVVGVCAGWMVITTVEEVARFGLFDIEGNIPTEQRWEHIRPMCECTTPPCRVDLMAGMRNLAFSLFVVLIDFAATRGFAEAAEQEQAAMARTIETVEAIAGLLAGYDVDTVAEMLEEAEGRLPPAMHGALQRLEENLRSYRPYLPAILLEQQQPEPSDDCVTRKMSTAFAAPGVKSEHAAVVFTDIRASTSIWEAAPEAMKKAMATHNTVLRCVMYEWGGYEVKTIGDAFMVAFEEASAAVSFGLAAHEALLAAEWPAALLDVAVCQHTGLWGGLTVRVGVNEGPVTLETNSLTGRVDYFGHTVNVAARLEAACTPGAVAVPAELWARVHDKCAGVHASAAVRTELKGVSEPLPVCSLWPESLAGRERHPLHVPAKHHTPDSTLTSSVSTLSLSGSVCMSLHRVTTCRTGTVCALYLTKTSISDINDGLVRLVPLLEQSGGSLVSLLGNSVSVGWNVGQRRAAHEESAVRFAQRVLHSLDTTSLAIASGQVEHGDVGTVRQRFVTASGAAVEASLAVRRLAVAAQVRCLYTAEVVPGAVRDLLCPSTIAEDHSHLPWELYEMTALCMEGLHSHDKDDVFDLQALVPSY